MAISIRLATTGEEMFTEAYDPIHDIRVWELRLRFCHEMKSTPFFAWVFFHEQMLVDDAALVSAYLVDPFRKHPLPCRCSGGATPYEGRINSYRRLHSAATQKSPMDYSVQGNPNDLSLATRYSLGGNPGQGYQCRLPTNLRYWAVAG